MADQAVLVTGATGFVGRATCAALEEFGWAVTECVRGGRSSLRKSVNLDLADPASVLTLRESGPYDAIVHLGAHVGLTAVAEGEMFAPNVLATGQLAYFAKNWGAHLVFASTAVVHGARQQSITATSPIIADTPYAKTKWLAERLIESANPRHCILRIGGVFGRQGPAHLGLNRAIDGAIQKTCPTQVATGAALRNYVYVKDVADTIAFVVRHRLEGIHLLAGQEVIPVSAMMKLLCDVLIPGSVPRIEEGPEGVDQIIVPSPDLPKTRAFREALLDIRDEAYR